MQKDMNTNMPICTERGVLSPKISKCGAFPTMITPYNTDNSVDYGAVEALTEWYWKAGCAGIFASCQSSEIWALPEEDRVKLAQVVKNTADRLARTDNSRESMTIVASGHVSDARKDQIRELTRVAETGVDAVILITNRMDIANTSSEAWIRDTDALVTQLPSSVSLGLYECPHPYKRLLTSEMLCYARDCGRFRFIKDTCCDAELITRRLKLLEGSELLLYNANAQTLLPTLRAGCAGYCGVMGNFHPQLYNYLVENFEAEPEKAELVAAICSMTATVVESTAYPITAKYHLREIERIPMELYSRMRRMEDFTDCHVQYLQETDKLVRSALTYLEG